GGRAAAPVDPARRRSPQPREPATGLPLPHALPVRAADALSRGHSAAGQARGGARGGVPLGGGHPGGTAQAARARTGLRAGATRGAGRAAADLSIASRSRGATRSSGGGRRRKVLIS